MLFEVIDNFNSFVDLVDGVFLQNQDGLRSSFCRHPSLNAVFIVHAGTYGLREVARSMPAGCLGLIHCYFSFSV